MNKIDLTEEQQGCLCLMCEKYGENNTSQLYARNLGPVCGECFPHTLSAEILMNSVAKKMEGKQ
jgi:hypothetical protein